MNEIPCLLQSNNHEEIGCSNKHWCVAHAPLDRKDIVGNFLTIANNKKKQTFEEIEKQLKTARCLSFTKSDKGAFKKAKMGITLEDVETGKTYVVTDEEQQRNSQTLKDFIEKTKKEIEIQHAIHSKYPEITPKIVAANIYYDYFFDHEKPQGCEMIDKNKKAFIQLLMENETNGGYENLHFNNKKYGINEIGQKNLNDDPTWLENEWYKGNTKIIIEKLFKTIHKVHELEYIHGDLKDDNIFIHPDTKDIKLIDFGLSYKIKDYKNSSKHGCTELETEVLNNFNKKKSEDYWYYIMLMELSKVLKGDEKGRPVEGKPVISFLDMILFPYKKGDIDYLQWTGTCTDFYKNTIIPLKKFIATKYKEYVHNNPKSVYVKKSPIRKKGGKKISFEEGDPEVTEYDAYMNEKNMEPLYWDEREPEEGERFPIEDMEVRLA